MGMLGDFDLRHLITDFGCFHLVMLGVGDGRSPADALRFDFKEILAVEPNHRRALEVAIRHAAEPRLEVLHERAEKGLRQALSQLPPAAPVLFWLALPQLESQLRLITGLRQIERDIFIIDDLNALEDGCAETLLGPTHELQRFSHGSGTLLALPGRSEP